MPYTKEKSILKLHEIFHNTTEAFSKLYARLFPSQHNMGYLIFSFVMAVFLWQSITGGEKVEEQYDLRLAINYRNLPEGLTIRERTDTVFIRVKGLAEAFKDLDRRELVHSIDLSTIARGANMLALDEDAIAGLEKFEIVSTNPSHLLIVTENYSEKIVELEPLPHRRELANGNYVRDIKISPNYVTIYGGESLISGFDTLNIPLNVGAGEKAGFYTQSVAVPTKIGVEADPPIVEISYRLEPQMEQISIEKDIKSYSYASNTVKSTSKKALIHFYCPLNQVGNKALYDAIEVYYEPYSIAANNTRLRASLPIEFRLISIEEK